IFQGNDRRTLILEGRVEDPDGNGNVREPIISWRYQKNGRDAAAALTIDGANATFENFKFTVEADDTPETSAGVIVMRGSGKLRLLKCSFLQKDLPQPPFIEERRQRVPLADVLVDNGDAPNELPRIELE